MTVPDCTSAATPSISARTETYTLPNYLRRGILVNNEPILGGFQDTDNQQWLFVGLAFTRQGEERNAIVVADVPPTRTLAVVLQEFRDSLIRPMFQAGLVGFMIALLLAVVISRNIAGPLQALTEAAGKVAEGNYAWRVKASGTPEVSCSSRRLQPDEWRSPRGAAGSAGFYGERLPRSQNPAHIHPGIFTGHHGRCSQRPRRSRQYHPLKKLLG